MKLEESFYWPGYRGDVVKFVQGCRSCQEFKEGRHLRRRWQELPPAEKPLDRISVDLTDLTNGYQGYRYVLTVMCHYSRFVAFYPLRNKTSEAVANSMRKYFLTIGVPNKLISDRGTEFTGYEFQQVCEQFNVTANQTLPFHPQGNSVSERMHRTFKTTIAVMSEQNPLSWPKYLDDAAHALNTQVHATTGAQPYFAFFSRNARRYVGVPLPTIDGDIEGGDLAKAHNIIKKTSRKLSRRTIEVANRNRVNDVSMMVGNLVWVLNEYQIPGTARKLNRKWVGPYRVEHVIRGEAAYKMSNPFEPEHGLLSRAADKIKRFCPESEFLEVIERDVMDDSEVELGDDGDELMNGIEVAIGVPESQQSEPNDELVAEEPATRYPQRVRKPRVPYTP